MFAYHVSQHQYEKLHFFLILKNSFNIEKELSVGKKLLKPIILNLMQNLNLRYKQQKYFIKAKKNVDKNFFRQKLKFLAVQINSKAIFAPSRACIRFSSITSMNIFVKSNWFITLTIMSSFLFVRAFLFTHSFCVLTE